MKRRMQTAVLTTGLAFLAAAPLHAGRGELTLAPEIKSGLVREWRNAIKEFSAAREHAEFLEARAIPLKFPDRIGNLLGAEFIASSEPDGIYIGEAAFASMADGLRRQGVRENELARVLALKTLGVLGHEIRHAIHAHALEQDYGIDFQAGLVEDEVLAHYDQMRITEEVRENHLLLWWDGYGTPMVDETNEDLRRAWSRGLSGLEDYIRSKPPMLDAVTTVDREKMAGRFKGYAEMIEQGLKRMEKREAGILAVPKERRSPEERELLKKIETNSATFRENLKKIDATLRTVDDPVKFQEMKDFYGKRMSEMRRIWRQEHGLSYGL